MTDDYSGMTVNERLFAAGMMEAFDAAVACQDQAKIGQILYGVGLDADGIERIIQTKLSALVENDGQT